MGPTAVTGLPPTIAPNMPMGPSGVIGGYRGTGPSPDTPMYQRWGQEAGALARSAQLAPQIGAPLPRAPGPMGPTGLLGQANPTADAAAATGIPANYLSSLIQHESGGKANAQASTSTASGPAQFTKPTWARQFGAWGKQYLRPGAQPTEAERDDLRNDPQWAALGAAQYTRQNQSVMETALGRRITQGEAYLGHFMGPDQAVGLIHAAGAGVRNAATLFPAAAQANRNVFFAPNGRARSAQEVIDLQTQDFSRSPLSGP